MDLTLPVSNAVDRAIREGRQHLDLLALEVQHGDLDLDDVGAKDRALALLTIYDLLAGQVTPESRWGNHPAVAWIRWQLEGTWIDELNAGITSVASDPIEELRRLAVRDRLPGVYKRLAHSGTQDDLVTFLAVEGGPDAGFDDLVAACQMGLAGTAKLELAANFWDEMGNGSLRAVHTRLHDTSSRHSRFPANNGGTFPSRRSSGPRSARSSPRTTGCSRRCSARSA